MNRRANPTTGIRILIVAGLLALLGCIWAFQPLFSAGINGQGYVVGKVLSLETGSSPPFRTCKPTVEYVVKGSTYRVTATEFENPCNLRSWRDIGIIYDSRNPQTAQVDTRFNVGKSLMIGGLGLLTLGIITWITMRNDPRVKGKVLKP